MNPARKRATYADLLQVPERFIAEIVDGELTTAPRPSFPHARAVSIISRQLDPFDQGSGGSDGPGGWWILFEPELHLGADILVPDIAGWRRERMPVLEDVPYSELAPDWARHARAAATGCSKCRSMPESRWAIYGWSIPACGPWKCTVWKRAAGLWRAPTAGAARCGPNPLRPLN